MKHIFILLIFTLLTVAVSAQQDHQYTQFMYNKLLVNPAYAGARGIPYITGIYRNQWVGFEGAPQSALVSLNSTFLSPRVGVGAVLSHQKAGLQRDFFGSLAYSYDLIAKEELSLRIGVQGSLRSLAINFNEANTGGGPGNVGNDGSLLTDRVNDIYGNVGAGIYATIAQRAYLGFSVPRIYSNTIGFNTNPQFETAKEYQHFYGMGGLILPINDDLKLLPAVLVKYVQGAPIDADINLNLDFNEKLTFGLSYRVGGDGAGDSVDMLAFWQANQQLAVGAAYDFPISRIRNTNAGSFEIILQTDLKKAKPNKKNRKNLSNPRYFL